MKLYTLIRRATLLSCLFIATSAMAVSTENKLPAKFAGYTENATISMDFSAVNELLYAGVLNMGYSTRGRAASTRPKLGTRMRQYVDTYTENEGNRFFYESLKKEQKEISLLKQYLEHIPTETPLHLYTKDEQLAYWLNLYNVTIINEIAKIYPLNNLKYVLNGENSLLKKKILNVDGIALSLHDIHYNILLNKYDKEPLIIYGLYQGIIGSPSIRKTAYTGKNVFSSLKDNAAEFINSNRGTQFNGDTETVRISNYYQRNAAFFPDFNRDIKKHLLKFSNKSTFNEVTQVEMFVPDIHNWRVTDIYGSHKRYEGAVASNQVADRRKVSHSQYRKLRELMMVRAINYGGGSVTVTDLESED